VREGERFVVDNTPPIIDGLEASVSTAPHKGALLSLQTLLVKFTARDATSSIERAQYSVDGGDWILVAPVGGVSDAPEERYEFTLATGLSPGEHTIAVRAYDHFENVGTAKKTITVPQEKL
jgi:hypothetical protein